VRKRFFVSNANRKGTDFMLKAQFIIGIVLCFGLPVLASDSIPISEDTCTIQADTGDSLSGPVYVDGVYQGRSTEWTGMTVEVHIEAGKISRVNVIEVNGTPEFYEIVLKKLPQLIEKRGSPEVDTITGATLSSESLKKAVRKALVKAGKS
jgi:uncharacterized protein with FMN-binding domain